MSMVPKDLLKRREELARRVDDLYRRGDHRNAERLDAELEDLDERIESMLQDMDDGGAEDDRGEEEREIDMDWGPQEEMARIYDQYVRGTLHLPDEEWTERDPSYRDDPEFQRLQRAQGYAMAPKGAFAQTPISKTKALADALRSAVLETPGAHRYGVKYDAIRSMPDEQVIAAAKDAWEWKRNLMGRIEKARGNL